MSPSLFVTGFPGVFSTLLFCLGALPSLSAPGAPTRFPDPLDYSLSIADERPPFRPRAGAHSPYHRRFVKGKLCRRRFEELREYAGVPFTKSAPALYRPAAMNRAARRAAAQGA